jgi:hypothetical protein
MLKVYSEVVVIKSIRAIVFIDGLLRVLGWICLVEKATQTKEAHGNG